MLINIICNIWGVGDYMGVDDIDFLIDEIFF